MDLYKKYVKYVTSDVCCTMISYDIEGNLVKNIIFHGGCPAGLVALAKSLNGKEINEIIDLMKNIKCGNRDSSCPMELVKSLIQELEIINNLPEKAEESLIDKIVNEHDNFINRSKIDLNKFKLILKIKPEILSSYEEMDECRNRLKDINIRIDSEIKDDFIFVSEKIENDRFLKNESI